MGDYPDEEVLDEEDFPEVDDVEYGPFANSRQCDFEYGGIEEFCSEEATHSMTFKKDDQLFRMNRCDDHGFPWVVRERKRRELGRPIKCQVCPQMGQPGPLANDVDGTTELETVDGDMRDYYVCEECAEKLDTQLEVVSA